MFAELFEFLFCPVHGALRPDIWPILGMFLNYLRDCWATLNTLLGMEAKQ